MRETESSKKEKENYFLAQIYNLQKFNSFQPPSLSFHRLWYNQGERGYRLRPKTPEEQIRVN